MPEETPVSARAPQTKITAPEPEPAEPVLAEKARENGHADRAAFLNLIGDLGEDTVELATSAGKKIEVLVRELTGEERAELITLQAEAYQKGSLEIKKYEQKLLMAG